VQRILKESKRSVLSLEVNILDIANKLLRKRSRKPISKN
jgi:hypothetical protein